MPTSKMAVNPVPAQSADDLRRTFETAIAQIQQNHVRPGQLQPAPKSLSRSKTPIFVRKQAAVPDDAAAEKRALTTAARALAQLWNISPTLIR